LIRANSSELGRRFTGRYRKGPEKAAIRLVFFTDYQCAHCRTLDSHIALALRGRGDVSVSIKHFPLNRECNPTVIDPKRHALACRAARIAEAAGLLGGDEAFWFIHTWLMRRLGQFTEAELARELDSLGLIDAARFQAALNSKEVADRVRADVQEGISLGIRMTPMLYINGVELNGLNAPGAVQRAIDALTAENLPPLAATADRPETRDDRLLTAWGEQPLLEIPADRVRWTLGPPKAPLRIVLFNDCLGPEAKETTRNLTDAARGRTDVRLDCIHYPGAERNFDAARLLEAAGRTGGIDGFWSMHAWLIVHGQEKNVGDGLAAAESLKLDREKLSAEYSGNDARMAVQADIELGVSLRISSAPTIFINGRQLPTNSPSRDLIERILAQALHGDAP
jgi:protein-disulfide isomerase